MILQEIASAGVHLRYRKELTQDKPIKEAKAPQSAVIPLAQHLGAACEPLVKAGDRVRVGTKLGDSTSFVTSPVHSSISGIVKSIEKNPHPVVGDYLSIVIENDGTDEKDPSIQPREAWQNLPPEQILKIIREAGVVGLGGATFPTHVKLSPPQGKKIETFILNGAECEPYLTCDYRLMIERTEDILKGAEIIARVLGVKEVFVAIEANKPLAIKAMREAVKKLPAFKLAVIETIYPAGAEKQLINKILRREVPQGKLPLDVGVVVQNVGTALAVYQAVALGRPLYQRALTITGPGIKEPGNYLVRVGTPIKQIIEESGGYLGEPARIILGGPMMGVAQYTQEVPVVKGTSGILVFAKEQTRLEKSLACMRCGRCIDVCPAYLLPTTISIAAEKGRFDIAKEYNVSDCIECGNCSYVCPSKRPMVQHMKLAKAALARKK